MRRPAAADRRRRGSRPLGLTGRRGARRRRHCRTGHRAGHACRCCFRSSSSQRAYDTLLGFGAGVMLAASSFSLVIPGLAAAKPQGAGPWERGRHRRRRHPAGRAGCCWLIDRAVPHEHFVKGVEGPESRALQARLALRARHRAAQPARRAGHRRRVRRHRRRARAAPSPPASRSRTCPRAWSSRSRCAAWATAGSLSAGLGMASGLVEPVGAVLGARSSAVGRAAALGPGLRGGRDAVRHQPRDHSRVAPQGPRALRPPG